MRRNRRHVQGEVELNLAAMLDMAFQLLAFFILTYRPAPVEGCIAVRMPPPAPITSPKAQPGAGVSSGDADSVAGAVSVLVEVKAGEEGNLGSIRIAGLPPVSDLADFEQKLKAFARTPDVPFGQVQVRVSPSLKYEKVLQVIEICARSVKAPGDKRATISVTEMP